MLTAELVSLVVLAPVQLSKDRSERNLVAIKWKRLLLPRSLASFPLASSPPPGFDVAYSLSIYIYFPSLLFNWAVGVAIVVLNAPQAQLKLLLFLPRFELSFGKGFFFAFLNGYFDLFAVQNFLRKFSLKHIAVFFFFTGINCFHILFEGSPPRFFFLFEKLMTLHWLLPVGVFDCTHPPPTPLAHVWY